MFAYTNLSMKTFLPIKIILLLFLLFGLAGCEKTPAEEAPYPKFAFFCIFVQLRYPSHRS